MMSIFHLSVIILISAAAGLIPGLLIRYLFIKKQYALPDVFQTPANQTGQDIVDIDVFALRLARLIRIPTVSWTDRSKREVARFDQFQEALRELFPRVHNELEREVHGHFGLIYRWKAKHPAKLPVIFLAHYDVVPAGEEGDETWEENPFGGDIKQGMLWGRGTLDIKSQLALLMETAERLLAQQWQPDRDIYFAFGGDEEISGREGAGNMASLLKDKGLKFEFIMDEGGVIAKDQLAFLKGRPAALVGLAEKGFVTFKITASGESGHSSMPPRQGTAISRLAGGIMALERKRFPSRLDPVLKNMLERFVPFVSFGLGQVFANLWLFSPLIRFVFSRNRTTDSLIRTTQAITVMRAGEQENILPAEAVCLVNHRILPGDTIDFIEKRHRKILKGRDLALADAGNWASNDPVRAGGVEGTGFNLIRMTLAKTHPGVVTVPYLVNGSTDSKYYKDLSEQIIRFTPLELTPGDIASIHGVNEKVSLGNLKNGLKFYMELFRHL